METKTAYQASDAELDEYGPRIIAILKCHIGRKNAITAKAIAAELGWCGRYDDRRVRMIIRRLVVERYELISSADDSPSGSWLIDSPAEARAYMADLKTRNLSIWERYRAIQKSAFIEFGIAPEQLGFDF